MSGVVLSPELQKAQERLALLRQQRREERVALGLPVLTDESGRSCLPNNSPSVERVLGPHLGWESEPMTKILRKNGVELPIEAEVVSSAFVVDPSGVEMPPSTSAVALVEEISCFPDMALALLRGNLVAPGRVWFLLRWLDKVGQGWLDEELAFQTFADRAAKLGICGQRQFANLLKRGNGLFWQWQDKRIWLCSAVKVAANLGLTKMGLRPVSIPLEALVQSLGKARAFLYTTFHSARSHDGLSNPISRHKLETLSHVSRRSQQHYEKQSGVKRCANIAIGPKMTDDNKHRLGAQHGLATFEFIDRQGRHGRPGDVHIAWQLPNSYDGPLTALSSHRLKRFNRQLTDLLIKGTVGNSKQTDSSRPEQCFYNNGQKAVSGFNRSPQNDCYWSGPKKCGKYVTWYPLIGQGE